MFIIYKNRESGKHFILINEIDAENASFITPEGKERPLEFKYFQEDYLEFDKKKLLDKGIVTSKQIEKCEQYNEYRADDDIDKFARIIIKVAKEKGTSLNDLLDTIDEREKEKGNDKLLIKLREKILEEMKEL